jgi:hypothetical protein
MTPSVSKLLLEEKKIHAELIIFIYVQSFSFLFFHKHTYSYVAAPYMNAPPWISGSSGGTN